MNTDRKRFKKRTMWAWLASSQRGAAAVEFALLVTVITAALTGIVNYGLAMVNKMELTSATRAGAQLALLDASDTSAIKQAVVDSTNLPITTGNVTTTEFCACADGTSPNPVCGGTCNDSSTNDSNFMTMSVSYTHTLLLLGTTITITGSTTVRTS